MLISHKNIKELNSKLIKGNDTLFHFYEFTEPVISKGKNTRLVKESPYPIEDRFTNGGALFISNEEIVFGIVGNVYKHISEVLKDITQNICEHLNIDGAVVCGKNSTDVYKTPLCADSFGTGEIIYKNKKLMSCAIKRDKDRFLLHGLIYYKPNYKKAYEVLGSNKYKQIAITEITDKLSFDEVKQRVKAGYNEWYSKQKI
jgi:lipoate-protein ligase A